jgi:hypothetical protein
MVKRIAPLGSVGLLATGFVRAIAVSEFDPNILCARMGESPIRGNVSHGDGIYKSTGAGAGARLRAERAA